MASKRLLIQTMDNWRSDLKHIKDRKAKELERRRRQNQKTKIKNSSHHA